MVQENLTACYLPTAFLPRPQLEMVGKACVITLLSCLSSLKMSSPWHDSELKKLASPMTPTAHGMPKLITTISRKSKMYSTCHEFSNWISNKQNDRYHVSWCQSGQDKLMSPLEYRIRASPKPFQPKCKPEIYKPMKHVEQHITAFPDLTRWIFTRPATNQTTPSELPCHTHRNFDWLNGIPHENPPGSAVARNGTCQFLWYFRSLLARILYGYKWV